jgi:hypothetical protein
MKIKNNKKSSRVLLEFDEFYSIEEPVRADVIDVIAKEFGARRMAYNMWEFESNSMAEEFIFMYRLKYANNR